MHKHNGFVAENLQLGSRLATALAACSLTITTSMSAPNGYCRPFGIEKIQIDFVMLESSTAKHPSPEAAIGRISCQIPEGGIQKDRPRSEWATQECNRSVRKSEYHCKRNFNAKYDGKRCMRQFTQ